LTLKTLENILEAELIQIFLLRSQKPTDDYVIPIKYSNAYKIVFK